MRNRIGKDLEMAASEGSLIVSDTSKEASYLGPDTPNMLLNLNSSNLPEWTEDPTIDGECRLTRQINGEFGRILATEADGLVTTQASILLYHNMVSTSGTPSATVGAGAGTGGSITVSGTNDIGLIEITTGTTPAASTDIATVSFNSLTYPTGSAVVLFPGNDAAADIPGAGAIYIVGSQTDWTLYSNSSALNASTVFLWNYIVKGY